MKRSCQEICVRLALLLITGKWGREPVTSESESGPHPAPGRAFIWFLMQARFKGIFWIWSKQFYDLWNDFKSTAENSYGVPIKLLYDHSFEKQCQRGKVDKCTERDGMTLKGKENKRDCPETDIKLLKSDMKGDKPKVVLLLKFFSLCFWS